jgi:hypothetical protein
MQVQGQLKHKFDTQTVSDKFKKREFILTTDGTTSYPQHLSFQCTQDKCELLEQHNVGDEVEVHFNLRGREWNGPNGIKYFNTLEAWRITSVAKGSESPQGVTYQAPQATAQAKPIDNSFTSNDLPF